MAEGRPEGRDLEHWMAAFVQEIAATADPRRRAPTVKAPARAGTARSGRG
ncbi:hypothetical protein [Dankookia sp. P2]